MGFQLVKWTNAVIYVLHWLVFCKYTSCVDEISAKSTCTGLMVIYADGVEVGRHNDKTTLGHFIIPANTQVVGIFCYADTVTSKVGGIIAQFDMNTTGDYFTDATWRCSETYNSEWMESYFEDKSWHYAKTLAFNGFPLKLEAEEGEFKPLIGIVDRAQYIWTDKYRLANGHPSVYCRGHIAFDKTFDHYGRRFAVAFTDNDQSDNSLPPTGNHILIATQKATWVTLYCFTPLLSSGKNYFSAVERIKIEFPKVIDVPRDLQHEGTVTNVQSGIICVSTASVSIVGMNTDTFLSLPLEYLGGENDATVYYALNWDPVDNYDNPTNGRVLIMAVYDDTVIQVFPGHSITFDGKVTKQKDMFEIMLKRYASCQFGENDENHSGTRLVSEKPFIVYCGNKLARVMREKSHNPPEGGLVEQMMPVKYWGFEFILTPLPSVSYFSRDHQFTWYKIIAAEKKTTVNMKIYSDFELPLTVETTLEAGEVYKYVHTLGETAYLTSTKGIIVAQFATYTEGDCPGNPWQMMIPPIQLYHNYYQVIFTNISVTSSESSCLQKNFVTIIVNNDEKDGIIIDEHPIGQLPTDLFTEIGYKIIPGTEYSYTNIYCWKNPGLKQHILRHEKPNVNFGVTVFSYGNLDSFATVAGIRMAPVNREPCVKTLSNALGDGLDNDCDGNIDDEVCSRSVSEIVVDCSAPGPVHGNWGLWEPSGSCVCEDVNNSDGMMVTLRSCSDPIPNNKGSDCVGDSSKFTHCKCERKAGGWSMWLPWSQCTGSCVDGANRNGKQMRRRTCSQPFPSSGGNDCTGQNIEEVDCFSYCPQDQLLAYKKVDGFEDCKFDLVIVMDRSGSIISEGRGMLNWQDMVNFVKSFIDSFTIGDKHMQIALITFSDKVDVVFEFGTNMDEMKKRVDKIPLPSGLTNTALALSKAYDRFSADRPDYENVVLFITDGVPTKFLDGSLIGIGTRGWPEMKTEAIEVAEKLKKDKNIEALLTIGVTHAISKDFLLKLAGEKTHYMRLLGFSDLKDNLKIILSGVCYHENIGFASEFIAQPLNIAVVQGTEAGMDCTAPNSVPSKIHTQVWENLKDPKQPSVMATNGKLAPAYQNNFEINGMYHLTFKKLTTSYGGQYCCRDTLHPIDNKRCAELIILESDPVFNDTISEVGFVPEGETVRFSCEVKYHGRWGPVMLWTDSSGHALSHQDMSTTGMVKTVVEFEATREDNDLKFTCTTHFGSSLTPPPGEEEANNIPDYTHDITSQPLIVYYSPDNTRIVDTSGKIVVELLKLNQGEKLACLTDSNPRDKDTFEWTTETGKALGSDPEITVNSEFLEGPTVTCTVRNSMGEDSAEVTILEESKSVSGDNGMVKDGAIGGVVGVLLLVGSVLLFSLMRRRKKKTKNLNEPEESDDDHGHRTHGHPSHEPLPLGQSYYKNKRSSIDQISNVSRSDGMGGFDDW